MLETMLVLNWYTATGTLILELALLGKLFSLIILSLPENNFSKNFKEFIFETKENIFQNFGLSVLSDKFLLFFIFLFAFLSSIMTLVYSEIFLQIPCALCWFQRIFMYGIVILSFYSLFIKDDLNDLKAKYNLQINNILIFSFFGAIVSLYHHMEQILAYYGTNLPCPVSGADCSKMTIFEYGHITFPWMAFIIFTFFIVIILLQKKVKIK